MDAFLKVLKRDEPRDMRVCAHEMKRSLHAYGYECLPSSLSSRQLLVHVCMYMHVNTAERLGLHKTVILLLIKQYIVLKIVSYSHKTTPCNLVNK